MVRSKKVHGSIPREKNKEKTEAPLGRVENRWIPSCHGSEGAACGFPGKKRQSGIGAVPVGHRRAKEWEAKERLWVQDAEDMSSEPVSWDGLGRERNGNKALLVHSKDLAVPDKKRVGQVILGHDS